MSYYEIYNESVNDLLNPTNKNLDVREKDGFFCIPNLTEKDMFDSQAKARFLFNQLLLLLATNKRSHKLKQIPCFETSIYEP